MVEELLQRGAVEHVHDARRIRCCRGARSGASAGASTTPSTAARRCSASPASCIVGHGRSSAKAVRNAVAMAYRFAAERFIERVEQRDRRRRGDRISDRLRLSRTGLAEGRHGQGAGRARFPICRETFDEADAALGEPLSRLCFEGPEDRLTLTENTQPAILAVSIAACRLLASRGLAPAFVAGPQPRRVLGATSRPARSRSPTRCASCGAAGATCRRRCRSATGAMAAILGLDAEQVAQACDEAAAGRGRQPGEPERRRAGRDRRRARRPWRAPASARRRSAPSASMPLPVSAPFHCALMKPAEDRLAPELRALPAHDPRVPVVANVDAEPKRDAPRRDRGADSRRCRRRCAGRTSCGALRPRASRRMLRWARARC